MSRRNLITAGAALSALISISVLLALINGDDGGFAPDRDVAAGLDGAALFGQSCAQCHGAGLDGTRDGPPLLDDVYRPVRHGDGAFVVAVRAHHWRFGNMPPVPGLSDEQLQAIMTFIRAEQVAVGIE